MKDLLEHLLHFVSVKPYRADSMASSTIFRAALSVNYILVRIVKLLDEGTRNQQLLGERSRKLLSRLLPLLEINPVPQARQEASLKPTR